MPVTVQIYPNHGMAHIQFSGHVLIAEAMAEFERYTKHPDFSPYQKQLVDFSRVDSFEHDYAKIMGLQARIAEDMLPADAQVLLAYFAPTDVGKEMSRSAGQSWEGIERVIVRMFESEADTLHFLGLSETELSALKVEARPADR